MQAVCMVDYRGLRQESISRATPVLQLMCKPAERHTTRTFQSAGELQRRPEPRTAQAEPVPGLHFSPPDGRSTRYDRQDFVALACRARRTVQVRLRAPSGSRLVLTALSTHFASPRGEKCRLAGSNDVAPRDAVEANVINIYIRLRAPHGRLYDNALSTLSSKEKSAAGRSRDR